MKYLGATGTCAMFAVALSSAALAQTTTPAPSPSVFPPAPAPASSPAAATSSGPQLSVTPPKSGANNILINANGMTLYISDKDTPGKSNCDAACVTSWPAVLAAPTAQPSGKFTIVSRADGGKQWAYDGKPLYQSKSDVKAGDKTGDGAAGTWHTAVIVP